MAVQKNAHLPSISKQIEFSENAQSVDILVVDEPKNKMADSTSIWHRVSSLRHGLINDNGLTKKASLNALAAALDFSARLLVNFLVTPLLVGGLGDAVYGIWQVLERITGYLSAASGRSTQTLKWTLANLQGSTDHDAKRRHVGSAVAVSLLFAPLLIGLGGLLIWQIPTWLDVPAESVGLVRIATTILVIKMALLSLVYIPQSVLQGENIGYKRMGLSALLVALGGGLMVLAILLGWGLVGVAAATFIITLLTGILFLHIARNYVPWFGVTRPAWDALHSFLGLSGWFLVWRLVMQLMMASDIVLLGMLVSVETVTTYTLTKYVPETLVNLVAIIVFGITPGLGGIIGAGDRRKATKVRGEIMLFTWLIATVVGTLTLLWNASFVRLWVGESYYIGLLPNLLIVVMMIQFVLIRNDANIIDLTLNLPRKVLMGVLSVSVAIGLAVVLVRIYDMGIVGLCLGFIAGRLILSLGYPVIIGRFLGISFVDQLQAVARPVTVMILFFALAAYPDLLIGRDAWLSADRWLDLIGMSMASFVVVASLTFGIGLNGPQQRSILQRIQHVVRT